MSVWFALFLSTTAVAVPEADQMRLFSDGNDHYIAFAPPDSENWGQMYYGDGKTFYEVLLRGSGRDGTKDTWEMYFFDNRFPPAEAELRHVVDKQDQRSTVVQCGDHITAVQPVDKDKTRKILNKAKFERSPHQWGAYALARDEHGIYYYVERGRWNDNRNSFRVFIGPRGKMKEAKLTNVVDDSEGSIFATTTGTLRLVLNKGEYWWVAKDERLQLTIVPPERNRNLIYHELGVYLGVRFGTPCDDL